MAGILSCIESVCSKSTAVRAALATAQTAVDGLSARLQSLTAYLQCVVFGASGGSCSADDAPTLPTLAEAIARLNATSISGLSAESFTATASQTEFELATTPSGAAYLELRRNGSLLVNPADYTLTGDTATLVTGASAGDEIDAVVYLVGD